MTKEEQAKKIEEIYNEAMEKLSLLAHERNGLIKERQKALKRYVKDLETKKIEAVKSSLKSNYS